MNNNKQDTCSSADLHTNEFNCVSAVEQVYPAEIIDSTDYVNEISEQTKDLPFDPQAAAANDALAYADIYSLNSARRAKHNQSLDRRSSKSQLTDRRSSARLSACGELHQDQDRRADNRAANIDSIRRLSADSTSQSQKQNLDKNSSK